MKKCFSRPLCAFLAALLLLPAAPGAYAYKTGQGFQPDLSDMMDNGEHRRFVQMMVDYYVRNDSAVRQTLEDGYSAVFLFEGCSDNMDDPQLSDLNYYRVSAVCVAVKLDGEGEPYLSYFNQECSTLPDRPLEYGAWYLADVGEVGPATVCDGTYELYSIRHGGAYEALHVRTSRDDDTVSAVYMTPDGYTTARADEINIHTRTVNHTIQGAMWSAGCLLIGDGQFGKYTELIDSTYYAVYDEFQIGQPVGTLTINRQCLKEELYALYENTDAVDMLLSVSRQLLPEKYLNQCETVQTFQPEETFWASQDTELMTLPCSNATDARSVALANVADGKTLEIVSGIRNSAGNLWYEANRDGERCYVYSGSVSYGSWLRRLLHRLFS